MTFEEDMLELSRNVARLLARDGHVEPEHLPLALSAHGTVVQLLRDLHRDLTGLPVQVPKDVTLEELERDPLKLLGRLLHRHPTLPGTSLIEALSGRLDETAALWGDVARHATLAHHGWETSDPRSRPRGAKAWGLIGDVAALAEAVPALDSDLAESLRTSSRLLDAAALDRAAHCGLRSAANAVRAVAADKPRETTNVRPRDRTLVLRVRALSDLPVATERLAALLRGAKDVTPQRAAQCAVGLARVSAVVADAIDPTRKLPDNAVEAAAVDLRWEAEALSATAREARRFVSVHESDPRPGLQMMEIRQFMTSFDDRWPRTPPRHPDTLIRMAEYAGNATQELALTIRESLSSGRWLRPCYGINRGIDRWAPATADGESERLQAALDRATSRATSARTLARAAAHGGLEATDLLTDPQPGVGRGPRSVGYTPARSGLTSR